jgi:hypothetical protein
VSFFGDWATPKGIRWDFSFPRRFRETTIFLTAALDSRFPKADNAETTPWRTPTVTPEQIARQGIDQQLSHCGWFIQDFADMDITASHGVAVREFPLKTGVADYMLYVEGRAAGVAPVGASPATIYLPTSTGSGRYQLACGIGNPLRRHSAQGLGWQPGLGRRAGAVSPDVDVADVLAAGALGRPLIACANQLPPDQPHKPTQLKRDFHFRLHADKMRGL